MNLEVQKWLYDILVSIQSVNVTHAYDAVDNAMIWNIVINHLPSLKSEVEKLLS